MRTDSVPDLDVSSSAWSLVVTSLYELRVRGPCALARLRAGGRRERRPVEYPSRFVPDFLKQASHGTVAFGHTLFAGRVRRLADTGHQREWAVERPNHFADADAIGRPA